MYIPKCPSEYLLLRSVAEKAKSTAESFKHWDTCMNNKTCKIVAIVGIVVAAVVVFSLIFTFVRCCCMGLSMAEAICCCCCSPSRRNRRHQPLQEAPYQTFPRAQPMGQPAPNYYPMNTYTDSRGNSHKRQISEVSDLGYRGYNPTY